MGKRLTFGLVTLAVATAMLAGCTPGNPAPTPSATATEEPVPSATPTAVPEYVPGGTAILNQPYFDFVNQALFDRRGFVDGRSIIDTLVAAGFTKADMEVTPDETSVGLRADSIIFSVRFKDQCLIGQFQSSGYHSTHAAVLETGTCLVGQTRPINW